MWTCWRGSPWFTPQTLNKMGTSWLSEELLHHWSESLVAWQPITGYGWHWKGVVAREEAGSTERRKNIQGVWGGKEIEEDDMIDGGLWLCESCSRSLLKSTYTHVVRDLWCMYTCTKGWMGRCPYRAWTTCLWSTPLPWQISVVFVAWWPPLLK